MNRMWAKMWVNDYLELLIVTLALAIVCIIFTIIGMKPPKV